MSNNKPSFEYIDSHPTFIPWTNYKFQSYVESIINTIDHCVTNSFSVPSFNGKTWLCNDNLKFDNTEYKIQYQNEDTKTKYIVISLNDQTLTPILILYETGDGSFVNDESNTNYYEYDSVIDSEVFFNKLFIFGSKKYVDIFSEIIRDNLKKFSVNENQYRADMIISDGGSNNVSTTKLLTGPELIVEAYPYLDNLENQIDSFLNSKQTIMLMQGPPGTGKTTLIKYIASKMLGGQTDKRALLVNVSADDEIIKASQFKRIVTDLIKPYNSLIVLEDSDAIVQSRKSGNSAITPLFTLIDGLFSINNKWIFTTNLDDTKKIDAALLRPGRCHSFIKTRELTIDELHKLGKRLKIDTSCIKKNMTLAEFFHKFENENYGHDKNKNNATGEKRIGFI